MTDMRVVGGLALTIALVIATSIPSPRRLRSGHLTVIALMGLVLAVRLFGFAHDGTTLAMGVMNHGHGTYTLSVPMRVHQNFKPSLVDLQLGKPGGGDLADSLIIAQYSWRF
jgi:hypothetical protein